MKILIDTNILFSAIIFKNSVVAKAIFFANENHEVYLTDQNIEEPRRIIREKAPQMTSQTERFLASLEYTVIPTVQIETGIIMRDTKDQPILNAAILNDLDIILTGDKDFLSLNLDRPQCLTPAEFLELNA